MSGHVQADGQSMYLLRGWKGDEDEDVDVDSSGGSSEEEIEGLKQHAGSISVAAQQPVILKKLADSAETSVRGTFNGGGQECDSLATKSQMVERDKTCMNVEQILDQTVVAKQVNAKKPVAPGENFGAKGISRLQPRKLNDGKRLDARRFRDHFAAKLVGSRRSNITEGHGQGETGNAPKDKVTLNSPVEPLEGESSQQADLKAIKNSSIEIEEEAVLLHVNLEVEQEKDLELPCNGDCNTANKESFQVFTRKRKQAFEGATQIGVSEKVSNQDGNGVEAETIDERSSDPKDADAECMMDKPPESPKSNSSYGRSKRARKLNRQADYIPWSDFGRLSRKTESYKSEMLVDSALGTETDFKQIGSKTSLENGLEESTKDSAHPSTSEEIELDDQDKQKDMQSSTSASVIEKCTQLPRNPIASSCPANGEELEVLAEICPRSSSEVLPGTCPRSSREVFPETCPRSSSEALPETCPRSSGVQDKDDHQPTEIDGAKAQDGDVKGCHTAKGTVDLAEEGSIHRMEVLKTKYAIGLDPDSDPNRHLDPTAPEQMMHEDPSTSSGLSKELRLSTTEGSEKSTVPTSRQESIESVEPSKGIIVDDHDSMCNKCKQVGHLICCDGKNCKVTFHISCLDPPLRDVPPNDWYCPGCACKRFFGGMHLVSKGIESIWDVKVVNDGPADRGAAQPEVGRLRDVRQPEEAERGATRVNDALPLEKSSNSERLYFVKYKGIAHSHNLWLGENQVSKEAPKLLINYKKQVEQGKAPKWDPEWVKPFRVIGKRKTMLAKISDVFPTCEDVSDVGHCIEWCVKWKNLGYEACTWEPADKPPLDSAHAKKLIEDYESRSAKATRCSYAEDTCRVEANSNPRVQPIGMLVDYQSLSEVIEKLLSLWQKHINSIAVNEIHQDRMRTAVGFLLYLYEKFAISKPCLVIVSPLLLGEWKAAFRKWMPNANVVAYAGSKEARKIIQRYEFYNEDGFCMVQIVLTSADPLNLDIETLKELSFEALIIDEYQRLKGTKTSKSLRQFASSYRLLLLSEPIKNNLEDYQYIIQELAGGKDVMPHDDNATLTQLKTSVSKHIVQEAKQEPSSPTEFWVPVKMTAFQLEQYCKLVIDKCDLLVRGKRADIASSPQELLLKLRECCNHPFLVKPGFQESLTYLSAKELLDFGIAASGKLKLLDTMLWEAKASKKRVVIITQINLRAGKVSQMDILDDYMRQQFGVDSYERLDGGVEKSKRSAAVQRFNASDSKCLVFLLDRRASGSSIKLRSVNCIVIYDSDWNPQTDIQSLLRMFSLGDLEHMTICRFYCTHTVEERVLISARKHSDLDSNLHNFTLALCQKLLRWGASKNFELFDTFSRNKAKPTDEVLYSVEIINHFLGKGSVESFDELCAANWLWETALVPRRASEYSKGLPLYEEKDDALVEEERVSAAEFWADLLRDRQVEAPDVQVRELRARKKVQYHEDLFDVSNTSQASGEEEEESRRKRRKVSEFQDSPAVGKGGRSTSLERNPIMGIDAHNPTAENLERSHTSNSMERTVSQRPKPSAVEVAHSPIGMDKENANRGATESRVPNGEPESTGNEATIDPTVGAKSEQQQALLSMKADLVKLCQALQFQADTAGHVEQLLFSVGNFFKLPKERSLLHAIELSLCWLAAEQQHYSIDRQATLTLAESCFGVQLDKIETVYAKLEERWKKRLEQGAQQSHGSRGQEKEAPHVGEQDRAGRMPPEQETLIDKHVSSQAPANVGSLEGSHRAGQEVATPRDGQLFKQGSLISPTTQEQQQGSAPPATYTSAMPLEGQVAVERLQAPAGIQEFAPLEPSTDAHRDSLSQQQRSERFHSLINAQKSQIAALELLEGKYKKRLKQHYESALAKFPRASSEEQIKLLDCWRRASSALLNSFKSIRGNLIKHQFDERGKEHNYTSLQAGRDNVAESSNRTDIDFSEESIFSSLPQGLRTAIETGDFGAVRSISGLDRINNPPPCVVNNASQVSYTPDPLSISRAINTGTGPPPLQGPPGVDLPEPQMHVAPNLQQQRHLQQRQVQDSLLQQRRPGSDLIHSQTVSSQNQQRQHPIPQQQRLPVPHLQSLLTSPQRPSSPIPLPPQPSLSQAPLLPQQPQLVAESQQSQPLQRGIPMPPRFGHLPNSASGPTLTLPNEAVQPLSVSSTFVVPPSSVRVTSGGAPAPNRTSQSGQPRSNQQYQNDPLAQEFLRLRKEQEKLKSFHESEKDRIKAQFMKELEMLSKKYEVMLQDEDSSYTQKASALESNLKKVEMNRRLAEVFRLKNSQDSHAVAPLFERQARAPAPSIPGPQLAGALAGPSWQYSQGPTSNSVAGLSQSASALSAASAMQSRSMLGGSAPGSHVEPFRLSTQLSSIPANVLVPRLSSPRSYSFPNNNMASTSAVPSSHVQDPQVLNLAPVGSYFQNQGNGGSLGGVPTNNLQPNASLVTPQGNSTPQVLADSIALPTAPQTLAGVQQDSYVPLGALNASDRPTPPLANIEESEAVGNTCTISAAQGNRARANPDTFIATTLQSLTVQNDVINGLSSTHSREGQDHGPSDVICLSDDD